MTATCQRTACGHKPQARCGTHRPTRATTNDSHPPTMRLTIYGWSTDVERLVKGPFRLVDGMVSGQGQQRGPGWSIELLAGVGSQNAAGGGRAVGPARRAGAWWIGRTPH
jgi:hypothetical protein